MAEASLLSRITRHKHYTRIGKHAHSFQKANASRKNIQANLARCVSVGAPNARRDKPRSPLTCDQHCSPHFCTQNDIAAFSHTQTLHPPNAPPPAQPHKTKNCGGQAKGHAHHSLARSLHKHTEHQTLARSPLLRPGPWPISALLRREEIRGVLWTPGTSFFSDGSPGSRSISLVHAPSDWPDRK